MDCFDRSSKNAWCDGCNVFGKHKSLLESDRSEGLQCLNYNCSWRPDA